MSEHTEEQNTNEFPAGVNSIPQDTDKDAKQEVGDVSYKESTDDAYEGEIKIKLSKAELQDFSQLDHRGVLAVGIDWLVIAAAITVCELYWSPLVYLAAVLVISGRLYGLGILAHEAVHYRLLSNRKWNDRIGDFFTAWPNGITVYQWRKIHFAHHRSINTEKDPDWVQQNVPEFSAPKSKKEIAVCLLQHLFGYTLLFGSHRVFKNVRDVKLPNSIQIPRLAFLVFFLASAIYFNFWKEIILYITIPSLTVVYMFSYLRSVAEHHAGLSHETELLAGTRTTLLSWWESLFVPHCINYHIEHHMYPSVPFYNLPKLHKRLMEDPVYAERAHITRGYFTGLLREWSNAKKLDVQDVQ